MRVVHRTAEVLQARRAANVAAPLPSCGEGDGRAGVNGAGLSDDVGAVGQILENSDEPTVVVAHSCGGIMTAEPAAGIEAVRHVARRATWLGKACRSFNSRSGPPPGGRSLDLSGVRP